MKKYSAILIVLFAVLFFSSCEKDGLSDIANRPYDKIDNAGVDAGAVTLSLTNPEMDVVVSAATESTTFEISVALWGPVLSSDITVPFTLDSTSLDPTAFTINGSEIVIPAGSNRGVLTVDLKSAPMFPGKIYKLYYTLGQPSVGVLNELASKGVVSAYNPGFLGPWVGTYNVHAASYGDPGNWDEEWVVTTSLAPSDPLHSILMYGVAGGAPDPLLATIDVDALTITIQSEQVVGDSYGYGDIGIYWGSYDADTDTWTMNSDDIVGTVDAETGAIYIDNFGELLVSGAYTGYTWDAFNTTWTKTDKSTTKKSKIPSSKKMENR